MSKDKKTTPRFVSDEPSGGECVSADTPAEAIDLGPPPGCEPPTSTSRDTDQESSDAEKE